MYYLSMAASPANFYSDRTQFLGCIEHPRISRILRYAQKDVPSAKATGSAFHLHGQQIAFHNAQLAR
jgi:hypothetical protein